MKPSHLLLAAPIVGLFALHLVDRRSHASELGELRSELAARSARSAPATRHATLDIAAHREAPRFAPSPVPAPVAPPATAAPASDGPPRSPPLEMAEARTRLERTFTQQSADARWADEARGTAEAKLAAALPATSKLQALECRSSMCRIETVHQSLDSYRQFVQTAFMSPETKLWNGGFFVMQVGEPVDGKLVTVAYLARDGQELPPVGELAAP